MTKVNELSLATVVVALLVPLAPSPVKGSSAGLPLAGQHASCSEHPEWTVGILYAAPELDGDQVRRTKLFACGEENAEELRDFVNEHGFATGEYTSVAAASVRAFTLYETLPEP